MVPKHCGARLFSNMEIAHMHTHWQTWEQPAGPAAFGVEKEPKLKLSVETRNHGDVIIVHCQGRIVYRDEAAALSRVVGEILHQGTKLVLELSGVTSMDSAGIGELALLQTWAQDRNAELKCAGKYDRSHLARFDQPGFCVGDSSDTRCSVGFIRGNAGVRGLLTKSIQRLHV
jgi:anti-anti-sigma factor